MNYVKIIEDLLEITYIYRAKKTKIEIVRNYITERREKLFSGLKKSLEKKLS